MNAAEKVRVFACLTGELEALRDRSRAGEDVPADELEATARELLSVVPTWDELADACRAAGLPPVTFAPEILENYVGTVRILTLTIASKNPLQ